MSYKPKDVRATLRRSSLKQSAFGATLFTVYTVEYAPTLELVYPSKWVFWFFIVRRMPNQGGGGLSSQTLLGSQMLGNQRRGFTDSEQPKLVRCARCPDMQKMSAF